MIVTIVSDVLGEANNGTTIAALNLIKTLTEKGHTVRVLCPDKDKREKEGYYIVPTYNFGPFQPIVDKNGVVLAKPDSMTIARALHDTDEVHIMMPFFLGVAALKIANRLGKPVSAGFHVQAENVTAHFFNFMGSVTANRAVYRAFYHYFYKDVDAIHYPTQFIRDVFENTIHVHTPGYVISNGVNSIFRPLPVERPAAWKDKFVILCTGRYSKEKKQTLLIKAAAHSKYRDKLQIVFAGEGPRLEEMKRCAKRYHVDPEYRFFSREELVQMINMADLYVHTSEVEIEAISCLEALSCGIVPLINNSPRSATRYFALGESNLFKLNDYRDLAKKMDYWLDHPEEKKRCAEDYANYCEQFNFASCMDRMERMIVATSQIKKEPRES